MTLKAVILGRLWMWEPVINFTTRPLSHDACCLLGEDWVHVKVNHYPNSVTRNMSVWMIGDFDENGYDRYPDFTIPRSTTWTPR
jgi:hypothetical protein